MNAAGASEDWAPIDCGGILLTEQWAQDQQAQRLAQRIVADEEKRSFRGQRMPLLAEFFEHFRTGQVQVLEVRDFNYHDTLEREVWLLDTTQVAADGGYDSDTAFVILHVHTAEPWERAQNKSIAARDWSQVTQMNIRNTSGTTPFLERNPKLGRAKGWSGKARVSTQQR